MKKNRDTVIWEQIHHFKKDEFSCKCGCGLNNINLNLVADLEIARKRSMIPFVINSACRCINHNHDIKGSITSSHLKGVAVDIKIDSSSDRYKIVRSLIDSGFNRIGVYEDFIHVDIDSSKIHNVIWHK